MFKFFIMNFTFWPFKKSKNFIIFFTCISMILSFTTFFFVPTFDMIMDMNDLGFNVVFSISALGISILGLDPKKQSKENTSNNYFARYIGFVLVLISILIFVKLSVIVMQLFKFENNINFKLIFVLQALVIINSVSTTMSNFVRCHSSK